ncbi:filamentation induced by cAMP protein Fic [Denitrovibrio acetiphilus DSM 12809]|uniref:Filamentation induced by cAMP protein Fic n=1 Tax=Denitrovibrio acetiphilus (strain DSM 12809 / NBRC 114555 / N2460) TaxID=522772 RepID=D4H2G5_DENA2|nr:Fic family protein [Denitrovibrio acetiphilus]ADD68956.1 filamentation induced by cAMP protein Fic [Denitrovibrio acetiphilus DSM 12809]
MVTKRVTATSKVFLFSDSFDKKILNEFLTRAAILNTTISDIPMLPQQASDIDTEIIASSISGTAAIDGNPYTESDIRSVMEKTDTENYSLNHKIEIENLIAAYESLDLFSAEGKNFIITEEFIKNLHHSLTQDLTYKGNTPGCYRDKLVKVGSEQHGGIYRPPSTRNDIEQLMKSFIEWINSDELLNASPFVRAALAHYHLSLIHPFFSGNGRTARLLEAYILHSANIRHVSKMLAGYYYRNMDRYFLSFSQTKRKSKDTTPFLLFVLEAVNACLDELKERVYGYLYDLTMREYLSIMKNDGDLNTRQYELVLLMMEKDIEITLTGLQTNKPFVYLYSDVTEQTARRDLKKLTELNLLSSEDGKSYSLCFDMLSF